MLSDRNVRKITDQIERELRNVSDPFASDEKKAASLERIAQLKGLMSETPSRESIIQELASAIATAKTQTAQPVSLMDAIFGNCR